MSRFSIRRSMLAVSCLGFVIRQFLRAPFYYHKDRNLREFLLGLRIDQSLSMSKLPPLDVLKFLNCDHAVELRTYETPEAMLFEICSNRLSVVSRKERDLMAMIAALRKPKCIFEFGTNLGGTIYNLFLNAPPDCELYSIDIFRMAPSDSRLNEWLNSSAFNRILGLSQEFDCTQLKGKVDLIFVDAHHSYAAVKADTEKAMQLVAPGGIILWHDYSSRFPGLVKYLNALSRNWPIKHARGTSMAVLEMPA